MIFKLFLCFTIIPMIELYFLIKLGSVIGGFSTILIVISTGFAGAWLLKKQGLITILNIRHSMEQGIMPTQELIDALIIFAAGVILITPGLLTDISGLLLLLPVTRTKFKTFLKDVSPF